jgi:hypothetical protein
MSYLWMKRIRQHPALIHRYYVSIQISLISINRDQEYRRLKGYICHVITLIILAVQALVGKSFFRPPTKIGFMWLTALGSLLSCLDDSE